MCRRWKICILTIWLSFAAFPFMEALGEAASIPRGMVSAAATDGRMVYFLQDGLYVLDAQERTVYTLVPAAKADFLQEGDLPGTAALVCRGVTLYVLDMHGGDVYTVEEDDLVRELTLAGGWNRDEAVHSAVDADDAVFVLQQDRGRQYSRLLRIDMTRGSVAELPGRYADLASWKNDTVAALREFPGREAAFELVILDSQGNTIDTLARTHNSNDGWLCTRPETDELFAVERGSICRLDGGKWTPLRALTTDIFRHELFALEEGFCMDEQGRLRLLDEEAPSGQVTLRIRGVFTPTASLHDSEFSLEDKDVALARDTVSGCCAEDVYAAIQSHDDSADLFYVFMSDGIRKLMQKGYLVAFTDEALADYADRLYPVFSEAIHLDGQLYAVPDNLVMLGWTISAEMAEAGVQVPETFADFLDMAAAWEDDPRNPGIPLIRHTMQPQSWGAEDYAEALYTLYVLESESKGSEWCFSDPAFTETLEKLKGMSDAGLLQPEAVDHERGTVFEAGGGMDSLIVHFAGAQPYGSVYSTKRPVLPPSAIDRGAGLIAARCGVYLLNPYSPHKAEAESLSPSPGRCAVPRRMRVPAV